MPLGLADHGYIHIQEKSVCFLIRPLSTRVGFRIQQLHFPPRKTGVCGDVERAWLCRLPALWTWVNHPASHAPASSSVLCKLVRMVIKAVVSTAHEVYA